VRRNYEAVDPSITDAGSHPEVTLQYTSVVTR